MTSPTPYLPRLLCFTRGHAVSVRLKGMLAAAGLASSLVLAAGGAGGREVAADAWFQRDFDANFALCAIRDNRPDWCQNWINAMEGARPKTISLSVPEWQRLTFVDNMLVCSTLLSPDWCPAWREAMKLVTQDPAYVDLVTAPAARRIKEEDERQARIEAWRTTLANVGLNKITPGDLDLIRRQVRDGNADAMEILAWMYLKGYGVARNYGRAYEYYGRAVLAGRTDLRPTLDSLWPALNEAQKNELRFLFK